MPDSWPAWSVPSCSHEVIGRPRAPLLFWSALCFFILVATNSLLFLDLIIFPQIDLALLRSGFTLAAFGLFLYGLIFESQP